VALEAYLMDERVEAVAMRVEEGGGGRSGGCADCWRDVGCRLRVGVRVADVRVVCGERVVHAPFLHSRWCENGGCFLGNGKSVETRYVRVVFGDVGEFDEGLCEVVGGRAGEEAGVRYADEDLILGCEAVVVLFRV